MIFFFEIPIVFILILFLCAIGLGWNIISNIETIAVGVATFILTLIFLFLVYCLLNLICRKKSGFAIILFMAFLFLLGKGIIVTCKYKYERYDAFYTKNQVTISTSNNKLIYDTIPKGSLVNETTKNSDFRMYKSLNDIPTSLECKYISPDGEEILVNIEKNDLESCGWIDCFGKLHEETD